MFTRDDHDGITQLVMTHGKVNALDVEFCNGFRDQLSSIREDTKSRALVLTASGRVFSAGVDLKRLIAEDADYLESFLPALIGAFDTIFRYPKPVVAAINGHAVAGGCILASACDHRVIVPSAKIGIPELRVGVPLPTVAIEIMRLVAAPSHFQQLVNLGATFVGEAAVSVGLADAQADRDSLMEWALEKATQLAAIPTEVFTITKRQIRQPAFDRTEQDELLFRQQVFDLWRSEGIREVVKEYVGRRL